MRRPWFAVVLFLLAACGAASLPTATPTATPSSTPTITPSATPPATFTPIPSFTPPPPRATLTRRPTATLTPTFTAAQVCEGFFAEVTFDDGQAFTADQFVSFLVSSRAQDVTVVFLATQRLTDEGEGLTLLPGRQMIGLNFPVSRLPGPGPYDWRLSALSETYGELCVQRGTFRVLRVTATPRATATVEPTATMVSEEGD